MDFECLRILAVTLWVVIPWLIVVVWVEWLGNDENNGTHPADPRNGADVAATGRGEAE